MPMSAILDTPRRVSLSRSSRASDDGAMPASGVLEFGPSDGQKKEDEPVVLEFVPEEDH